MTVAEMGERMTHHEYMMWSAYYARVAQRKQVAG